MLNSSSIHHTVNMKLLLLVSVICFSATLAVPTIPEVLEKQNGHNNHHDHHHHDNEVSNQAYGELPNFKSSHEEYLTPSDIFKSNIHVPSTSYGIPDTLTTIHEQPKFETVQLQKSVSHEVHTSQPVVHKQVETSGSITVPRVKVATSNLPETQAALPAFAQQHFLSTGAPSFTSISSSGLLPTAYTSYPTGYAGGYYHPLSFASSSVPVKTVDRHVRVQVPQPYAVPVTKHVNYPVAVPHAVEVPKPYYVRVPQPVAVPVNRPYAVEVPRAVPYSVPQVVHTVAPDVHHPVVHHQVEAVKDNPVQTFFENTFQDSFANLQNPFDGLPIPQFPSFPSFIPSFTPSQPTQPIPAVPAVPAFDTSIDAIKTDAVSIENPTINLDTTSKSVVVPVTDKAIEHTHHVAKAATVNKEYVQPTDENGGYVY